MVNFFAPPQSVCLPYLANHFEYLNSDLLVKIFREIPAEEHKYLALVCKKFRANTVLIPFLHLRAKVINNLQIHNLPPFQYQAACYKPLHFSMLLENAVKNVRPKSLINGMTELKKGGHAQNLFSHYILNFHPFSFLTFEKYLSSAPNHPLHRFLENLKLILQKNAEQFTTADWENLNLILKEFYIHLMSFIRYVTEKPKKGTLLTLRHFLEASPPPENLRPYPYVLFTQGLLIKGSIRNLKNDPNYVDFLPNDIGFARCILIRNAEIFEFMPYSLRNNPEIVSIVAQRRWQSFKNATLLMKDREDIVLSAIKHNENAFFEASERLRTTRNFLFKAIDMNPKVYSKFAQEFQNDYEMCKKVLSYRKDLEPEFVQMVQNTQARVSKKKKF